MLPLKNFSIFKIQRRPQCLDIMCSVMLLLALVSITMAEPKQQPTPARLLAKQAGATQFEEERYETHTDCNEHKHHLKKRASDEDVDYEVYQGVVGRPGIDFPIHPRIPKTTFSCRSYGNGYFADMETDCQVFHICEEGRKISFLCPNGTIFQQSELTCDWWFKVNCLGSSGYYAESAEILHKQRVQRIRPSVPVQGFNIVGGGLNIKPNVVVQQGRVKLSTTPERRIDSNEEPVLESVDFDDVSNEKTLQKAHPLKHKDVSNIDDNHNNNDESQITAESASFVAGKRRNSFGESEQKPNTRDREHERGSKRNHGRQTQNHHSRTGYGTDERARHGQRGQQRFHEDKKPLAESFEQNASEESRESSRKVLPEKIVQSAEVASRSNAISSIQAADEGSTIKLQATTPYQASGTYTTARRLEATRPTPFYTPTVPAVSKSKTTESKAFYVKTKLPNGSSATTPNPNRVSSNNGGGASLLFDNTKKPGKSSKSAFEFDSNPTQRPFIIGMRHNADSEIHRVVIDTNNHFNADSPIQKPHKQNDYLPTSTAASTGPTYLPKSANTPKPIKKTVESSGGSFLFAPSPAADDSVTRNLNEMLKTMNLLKNKLDDTEETKPRTQQREGLEIPPSSGPDALVSLAKYFATETNDAKVETRNDFETTSNKDRPSAVKLPAAGSKPSDTTATITTTVTANIAPNADDIKSSLLSSKTVAQYTNLFGLKDPKGRAQNTDPSTGLLSNVNSTTNATGTAYNLFPQIGTTDPTLNQLAEKPESRKIAQVFSSALNTYLEDPDSFRAQLVSIRPTEPPATTIASTKENKARIETTTPKPASTTRKFKAGTSVTYLPAKTTTDVYETTTATSIAAEINSKFDFSTPLSVDYGSTTEVADTTTTYRVAASQNANEKRKLKLELSAELLPPSADSGEGEELLQRSPTQSFVKSHNNQIVSTQKQNNKKSEKLSTNVIKPTENPWNHISEADYLDPLTINDGLMKEQRSTTHSPFTYLPKETTTPLNAKAKPVGQSQVLSSDSQRLVQTSGRSYSGNSQSNLEDNDNVSSTVDNWQNILSGYDLPHEALPSSSGLQRIANKLFGGLNENEALHLKNVMAQAEHNRQVLSLLLLLIQTCDDQNGKALERSRKHLLNALIDMDGKLDQQHDQHGKAAHQKNKRNRLITTTTRIPVTTYRRSSEDYLTSTPIYATTTTATEFPATTDVTTSNQYPYGGGSVEETTKFEIRVADLDEDLFGSATTTATIQTTTTTPEKQQSSAGQSDKRALELLKSLYSLASKFTSRR